MHYEILPEHITKCFKEKYCCWQGQSIHGLAMGHHTEDDGGPCQC